MSRIELHHRERTAYPTRIGGALVVSLLLAIAAFRWWPAGMGEPETVVFDARGQELIEIEEIQPTRQLRSRPRPPAPVPPVVRPDDVDLPDVQIELTDNLALDEPGDDAETRDGAVVPAGNATMLPDAGPRPVRFVEPEYTEEARERRIRAEIVVEVLVDARGRVREARVAERYMLKGRDNDQREPVTAVGYGLEPSALAAAERFMFRPAREAGQLVESWTTLRFSFGL